MENKRGISPLVATVILVGVVIALATLIWFWYGKVIEAQTDKAAISSIQACAQDVDFEIKSLCLEQSTKTIRFKAQNSGIAIPRFKVVFTGDSGSVSQDSSIGVSTATTQDITVTYTQDVGAISNIRITPFIVKGEAKYCEDQSKEISSPVPC